MLEMSFSQKKYIIQVNQSIIILFSLNKIYNNKEFNEIRT